MPLRVGISNGTFWNTTSSLKSLGGAALMALVAVGCDVGNSASSGAEGGTGGAGASAGSSQGGSAQGGADQGGSGGVHGGAGGAGGSGGASGSGGAPEPGCTTSSDAAQPFGNHQRPYTAGSILPNHTSQGELDQAVRDYYAAWKSRYLESGCGDARAYVNVHNNGLTVSEAHGYGMLIAAFMAGAEPSARATFDGLFRYFKDHPSAGDSRLMAWKQGMSCDDVDGSDSATDGDLDIAYALLLADKQWGSSGDIDYHAEALTVIAGIRAAEISSTGGYLKLGDWVEGGDYGNATRSSDVMPGHFASFAAASNDAAWTNLADQSLGMFASLQANHAASSGLLPDFIQSPNASPAPAEPFFLENAADGAYGYNACRVPWRIGAYWLTSGDARAKQILDKQNAFIRDASGDDPWSIAAGYELSGQPLPNSGYSSLAYMAPFGVGAMSDAANQSWLNELWDAVITMGAADEYYGDTLKLLSLITMSGNWWTPAAAPCPDQ